MVEINFLAHKKSRLFSYIVAATFVLSLLAGGGTLLVQKSIEERALTELKQQLKQAAPQMATVEKEQILKKHRQTLEDHAASVEQSLFPAILLLDELVALLPEKAYFDNYVFERGVGLMIDVQIENIDQAAAYTNALRKETYIQTVNLSSVVESENQSSYIASYQVKVDEQRWMEEMTSAE